MGGHGYSYQGYSRYSSGGLGRADETSVPLIRKPFVPFVPGRNSDGYLASNANRSLEAEGFITKKTLVPVASSPYGYVDDDDDDEGWRRQTSPAHGLPHKVDEFFNKIQNEASRPAKFGPATNWLEGQRSPPRYRANGLGDSGNFSSKPTGNTIRNDNYDGYDGAHGYGDSAKYGNKDDGYGGDYGNKDGYKPTGNSIWNGNCDGYNGANGFGDYGKYSNTEGLKPTGSTRHQPAGNYIAVEPNKPTTGGWTRPNSSGWTPPPRNGTQLSEATNDIGKAIELLKEAGNGKLTPSGHSEGLNGGINGNGSYGDYGNKEGYRANGNTYLNDKYDNYPGRNNGGDRPNPSIWAEAPRNGSKLIEPTSNFGKAMKEADRLKPIAKPPPSTIVDGREANYRENIDRSDAPRRFGNLKFGPTINSTEAEKRYKGTRV